MGFNMQKLMQQAQKMQRDMAKAQEELAAAEVTGTASGGMVRVIATGAGEIVSIAIDQEIVDPDDVEMLEDMVLAAVKDALDKAHQLSSQRMSGLTGGMNMPGLF